MNRVDAKGVAPDPDELLARLVEHHKAMRDGFDAVRLEFYHRASLTRRLARDRPEAPSSSVTGREDGVAVRLRTARDRRPGFSAASGCDAASLRWAAARARSSTGDRRGPRGADLPAGKETRLDRDAGGLPVRSELDAWLDRACSALRHALPPAGGLRIGEVWVEVAVTAESLVGDGGFKASRLRRRAWAMARLRPVADGEESPRPLFVAGRSWETLSDGEWASLARDRGIGRTFREEPVGARMPVLFAPEPAGVLVAALARTIHTRAELAGTAVGPGWSLHDDPRAPGALFGGDFDDAGFATARRELADGSFVRETVAGPGSYRRPSFRDSPHSLPANLVLDSAPITAPRHGLFVSGLTLYPLPGGKWVLDCDGRSRGGKKSGRGSRRALIATLPGDLVQRCLARIGAARRLHRGVQTPALLFDGLEVRRV
jgi:hypothetical protein